MIIKLNSIFADNRKLFPWALVLTSAVIAVFTYLQALRFPFVFDDVAYIIQNTKLAELQLSELWRLFTKPYNDFSEFLPLRDFSYWFDIKLFGLDSSAFRLHNIILYVLCLPLVYVVTSEIWRYFRPADDVSVQWVASIVTALFALHPSHVEAVVWIAGRKDVLSSLFSLLALWFAISARREQGLSGRYASAALLALLAAILSKASAVAVAPVIALLWFIFWRDIPASNKRYSTLLWPLACLLLAISMAAIFATITTQRFPLYFGFEIVTRALAVLGWLGRLSISPESRHFFYPVFEDSYMPIMVALGAAIFMASMVGLVIVLRKRSLGGFTLAIFFLLCITSLQLVPYKPPSLVSDRFVFLAVWPVILLIVTLSWRFMPVYRAALFIIIAVAWGFQASERTRDWRNFQTLVDADLRAYPGYYMPAAFKIAGRRMYSSSRETANSITIPELRDVMIGILDADHAVHIEAVSKGNPQEAMDMLLKLGLRLKQPPAQTKWNPPMYLFWEKSKEMLKDDWEGLSKHFPGDAAVSYNAGLWMLGDGRYENAVVYLRAAIESQRLPESVRGQAFRILGIALMEGGHIAEAETPLLAALEQSPPDLKAYCLLSDVYKQNRRPEEAARANAECTKLVPVERMVQ
jgi:tetratricopeptide (TPR) repeat protein